MVWLVVNNEGEDEEYKGNYYYPEDILEFHYYLGKKN